MSKPTITSQHTDFRFFYSEHWEINNNLFFRVEGVEHFILKIYELDADLLTLVQSLPGEVITNLVSEGGIDLRNNSNSFQLNIH